MGLVVRQRWVADDSVAKMAPSNDEAVVAPGEDAQPSKVDPLVERDKVIRKLRESLERERNARAQMESKYKAASEKVSGPARDLFFGRSS